MSKGRKYVSSLSSLLAAPTVIIASFAASLLANWLGLGLLAVFLFTSSLVGLLSRLWGLSSLRRLALQVTAGKSTLSVGDTATISYTITNNKLLPVMWLELCQELPHNGCLTPDSGFSLYRLSEEEARIEGKTAILRRRVIFLMGLQSISWDTVWSAKRRGLYYFDRLTLRSGDGFGFTQSSQDFPAGDNLLVVWPRIVSVSTAPFFRNVWQGSAGRHGHVEDPTVLRGLRDYRPGDPWKRIDWRVAARQDELQVRQFETVLPSTVHFILDSQSFLGLSAENDELENAISVLASLILDLENLGISCGLSLPRGEGFSSVDLSPDDPTVTGRDLLYRLSALDAAAAVGGFDEAAIETLAHAVGQVWLLTCSGERMSCPALASRLENAGLSILCHNSDAPGLLAGRPLLTIGELSKGGGVR